MKQLFVIILFLTVKILSAQPPAAFKAGERLSYEVSYSASFFSTAVADVTFDVREQGDNFRIGAVGKTRGFFSIFFDMEDVYYTLLNQMTLRPAATHGNIKEGSYRYRSSWEYDWPAGTVTTSGHNLKSGNKYGKTMLVNGDSFDALALLYNIRSLDISHLIPQVRYNLDLVLEDTIRTIRYRVICRENIKIPRRGTFRTIKVACTIATENTESVKDGDEFFMWFSDDRNRIPIYMESAIRVGSIKVSINKWEGLKYPFTAKIE